MSARLERSVAYPAGMRLVRGGRFTMGSDRHYAEERPAHSVLVSPFWMDETAVTNAQFSAFVAATGYVTLAERPLDSALYPGAPKEMLAPGSLVFRPTRGPVDLRDLSQWWHWTKGACWHAPKGPGSDWRNRADHPVVHVAFEDAEAYAAWAGKALPSEAEFECAARSGLENTEFAWGDVLVPGGRHMANIWQGEFPYRNVAEDGFAGTCPVRSFPANAYGLFEMIGNTWEWTEDWFAPRHAADPASPCCAPKDPRGPSREASFDPQQVAIRIPRKVVKGGSFLCAPSYCRRYRPAARHAQMVDSGMSHIGFRCVMRDL